jgi:uncharacterized protein YqjF (DUF2071 family)
MIHRWRLMSFLHWRYPVDTVRRLLPDGLAVHTFDGDAWVGLLPFLMDDVRAPWVPPLPWLSRFPETNLRTYVRGPDGRTGIWFFSLDAGRLPAVAAARLGLGLPYCWSDMSVRIRGSLAYRGRRRVPGLPGAGYNVRIRPGVAYRDDELTPLDHFLTARYRLYSQVRGQLAAVDVQHPAWPLHRAELLELSEDLIRAAGLSEPHGPPLVHASPGVRVRIGMPQMVAAAGPAEHGSGSARRMPR